MTETPSRAADAVSAGGGTSPVSTARRDAGAPTPARTPLKRGRMSRPARRDPLVFLAFPAAHLLLIALFTYRPLFLDIQDLLLDWTLGSTTATFIGLDNYIEYLASDAGLNSLRITVIFPVFTVGGAMVLGLLIALALHINIHGRTVARS